MSPAEYGELGASLLRRASLEARQPRGAPEYSRASVPVRRPEAVRMSGLRSPAPRVASSRGWRRRHLRWLPAGGSFATMVDSNIGAAAAGASGSALSSIESRRILAQQTAQLMIAQAEKLRGHALIVLGALQSRAN